MCTGTSPCIRLDVRTHLSGVCLFGKRAPSGAATQTAAQVGERVLAALAVALRSRRLEAGLRAGALCPSTSMIIVMLGVSGSEEELDTWQVGRPE